MHAVLASARRSYSCAGRRSHGPHGNPASPGARLLLSMVGAYMGVCKGLDVEYEVPRQKRQGAETAE